MDAKTDPESEQAALLAALDALMTPLAHLAVARGLTFAALQESLKGALVRAASAAHDQVAAHRRVSRISTVTGINRREVTRLMQPPEAGPPRGRSKASEVFARWLTASPYCGWRGVPLVLRRQGDRPSFESLAQEVTRDVHPRGLLDELVRLGLAEFDEVADTVAIARDGFVPRGDSVRMLGFLADNVGDHLGAAVDNVIHGGRRHFEQAVFAEGISDASVASLRELVGPQWKALLTALVPPMQALVDADAALPVKDQRRMRIGLYAFDDASPPEGSAPSSPSATPPTRRRLTRRPAPGKADKAGAANNSDKSDKKPRK